MTDAKTLALVREALAEFACSNNDACYCDQVRVSDKETCRYRKAAAALAALDAEGEPTDLRKAAEQALASMTKWHDNCFGEMRIEISDAHAALDAALAANELPVETGITAIPYQGEFTPIAVGGSTKPKSPPAPSDAELVERRCRELERTASHLQKDLETTEQALAAEQEALKLSKAIRSSLSDQIARHEAQLIEAGAAIERLTRDLAAEREAHEQTAKDSRDNFNAACREKARAEAAEARVRNLETAIALRR